MSDTAIANRYARALVDLAVETNTSEALSANLTELASFFKEDGAELFSFLRNPVFDAEERRAVLDDLVPRLGLHEFAVNLLRVLSDRDRMSLFPAIESLFTEAMDEKAGRVRVHVRTVDPLTPQLEAEIRTAFEQSTGKQVILQASIDPSLIGGLVARIGGKVFDASIKTRLEGLRRRLSSASA